MVESELTNVPKQSGIKFTLARVSFCMSMVLHVPVYYLICSILD